MKLTMLNAPALVGEVRAIYPGAESVEVDRIGCVWVRCGLVQGPRDLPAGNIRLGTSPKTCALEARALAEAFKKQGDALREIQRCLAQHRQFGGEGRIGYLEEAEEIISGV